MAKFRLLLIPATIMLAVLAWASAFAGAWRLRAPDRVVSILPGDPVASMAATELRLMRSANPEKMVREVRKPAIASLAAEPLNPRAIRMLAGDALVHEKQKRGIDLLLLSQRISRRDLGTRLALIEYYSSTGEIAATLDQYDIALSTSDTAGNDLFPVLTEAIGEPDIRNGVRPYIRGDRPWLRAFLIYAIPNTKHPENLAQLFAASGGLPGHPDYRVYETQLLLRLATMHRYEALRAYFLSLPQGSPTLLRDVSINAATLNTAFVPLTWYLIETPEISAQPGEAGSVSIRAASGVRGTAIQRFLYLPPGQYRFGSTTEFPDGDGWGTWELRCLTAAGASLGWSKEIRPGGRSGSGGIWDVPATCPVQMLTLAVSGGANQADTNFVVGGLTLAPAR